MSPPSFARFGAQLLRRPLADHPQIHRRRDDLRGLGEVQEVGDHLAQRFRFVANALHVAPGLRPGSWFRSNSLL